MWHVFKQRGTSSDHFDVEVQTVTRVWLLYFTEDPVMFIWKAVLFHRFHDFSQVCCIITTLFFFPSLINIKFNSEISILRPWCAMKTIQLHTCSDQRGYRKMHCCNLQCVSIHQPVFYLKTKCPVVETDTVLAPWHSPSLRTGGGGMTAAAHLASPCWYPAQ